MPHFLKSLYLWAVITLFSLCAYSVPAKKVLRTLTLQDGSTVEVTLQGDETMHFYTSQDGGMFLLDQDGIGQPVHNDSLLGEWTKRNNVRNMNRTRGRSMTRSLSASNDFVNPIIGTRRGLVILADFPDFPFKHSHKDMDNFFNQVGYSGYLNYGSVHDYFHSQSYGLFDLEFDVIGPVTMSHNMSYYGGNDYYGEDLRPATMIIEACRMADNLGVDFSQYDWDENGWVDQVFVVYAGYGENQGASENSIWPHEWTLSEARDYGDGTGKLVMDGVKINNYVCSNELQGISGSNLDGIGSVCHEFSHCLGFPDFYDTNGSAFGMDCWSIMDYGCYNGESKNASTTPADFTSFERMCCGWLTPQVLDEPCVVTNMPPLDEQPCAYILYNEAYPSEFYMLENRQCVGWDKWGFGHGLLILHVDYSANEWSNNTVNTVANHQRMTIIPADNQFKSGKNVSSFDLAGDPWPGTSGNTALTDTSTPAATLFHANISGQKLMGHLIEDITELDERISFRFDGGGEGIQSPKSDSPFSQGLYDMQGRRWMHLPWHGIWIENGRKVLR